MRVKQVVGESGSHYCWTFSGWEAQRPCWSLKVQQVLCDSHKKQRLLSKLWKLMQVLVYLHTFILHRHEHRQTDRHTDKTQTHTCMHIHACTHTYTHTHTHTDTHTRTHTHAHTQRVHWACLWMETNYVYQIAVREKVAVLKLMQIYIELLAMCRQTDCGTFHI